jgi:hypothetical protein
MSDVERGEDAYLGTYAPSEELADEVGAPAPTEVDECRFCGALVALDVGYCGECDTEVIGMFA